MPAIGPMSRASRPCRNGVTLISVDDYIATFPPEVRTVLAEVRRTLHAAVPGAEEAMRYDIPTLTLDGRSLVHFAGWKHHVSVYPVPDGDADYERAMAPHRSGASTAKFPLDEPIPLDLVGRIARLLAEQRRRSV